MRVARLLMKQEQVIPLLEREGWPKAGVVSSAKFFRAEDFAELTTPSAALRWLRNFLLMPQPPLLGKEGKSPYSKFIHTFSALGEPVPR